MAARYSAVGPSASGTTQTVLGVNGGTTVRANIYEVLVGSSTTPADQTFQLVLGRITAFGTSTAYTPLPLDPNDVAAIATAGITHSAEPTYTAGGSILDFSVNQRATFRWVASPGGEAMSAASANNGMGLKNALSSAALVLRATVHWFE